MYTPQENNEGRTLVAYILDESGSMVSAGDAPITSFNEYIGDLRKQDDNVLMTLTKFQDAVNVVYSLKPIGDVEDLNVDTYRPGTTTSLYDAIGQTVSRMEREVGSNDKVLVVIMTDGFENTSKEFTQKRIFDLIKSKENEGNWTFVYLGANQDSFAAGGGLGISGGNILNYQSTSHGHRAAMRGLSKATTTYAASSLSATDSFFNDAGIDNEDEDGDRTQVPSATVGTSSTS